MSEPEEHQEIIDALQRTWQAIGSDIFECIRRTVISREEVIECVYDYIGVHGHTNMSEGERISKEFFDLPDDVRKVVERQAFPYERYGN